LGNIFCGAHRVVAQWNNQLLAVGDAVANVVPDVILVGLFYLNLYYLTPVILKRRRIVPFLLTIVAAIIVISFVTDRMHPGMDRPPRETRRTTAIWRTDTHQFFLATVMIASVSCDDILDRLE
jgi:hypothetical protein